MGLDLQKQWCNNENDAQLLWTTQSLMAEWLGRASQVYEMYCHDLEVMGSNPSRVELEMRGTSV